MSTGFVSADGAYRVASGTKSKVLYTSKDEETPKPAAIQGLIYCKSDSKLIPLNGATARVTCLARNHLGLELPAFSVSSCPADEKGYLIS
ncbi:hypothetical protein E3N88_05833 [Mikania micrantha]|uniref:Uncharacterized protein n=1 Tax=Mikania micrantha TaxID=192012 RepID=A0A5N6PP58_9ASTR|nr:hypothetical protein E3N88_05833 [Mikania micrantha]